MQPASYNGGAPLRCTRRVAVRYSPAAAGVAAAVELEELGFPTLWIPGGADSGVLAALDLLLGATRSIRLATGILNIGKHEPAEVAAWWRGQSPERRSRLLLGLGVSHGPPIGEAYERPLAKMRAFLDGLDAAGANHVCLQVIRGGLGREVAEERPGWRELARLL